MEVMVGIERASAYALAPQVGCNYAGVLGLRSQRVAETKAVMTRSRGRDCLSHQARYSLDLWRSSDWLAF